MYFKSFFRKNIPLKYRLLFHQLIKYLWVFKIWKKPKNRFIIYGMGRSGSTLLTSLINSHSLVFCDSEVISHNAVHRLIFSKLYLHAISKKIKSNNEVYGCGIMTYQLQHQKVKNQKAFLEKLVKNGWKIIHIRRNDIIKVAVSIIIAQQDSIWEVKKGGFNRTSKAYIPVADFNRYLKTLYASYKIEDQALKNIQHIKVNYENDLENGNWQPIMDKVFAYLDLNSLKVGTVLKKKSKGLIFEVKNYDELVEAFNNFSCQCH